MIVTIQSVGSKRMRFAGWAISGLSSAMLLLDGVMKLMKPAAVVQANVQLGYPEGDIVGIGVTLLVCTAVYVRRRSAIVGAILLTGYLGGAVASHVRVGDGPFPTLFPMFIAALVWGGLILRESRVRALLLTSTLDT
jgi:hypothetical protein